MTESYPIHLVVVLAALVIAAITDVRDFKVPNLLTGPLLLFGLLYHSVSSGIPGLAASASGALLGFGLTIPFYALGGMGAGDVKLLAAVGAWLGALATVCLFLASSLASGVCAIGILCLAGSHHEAFGGLAALARRLAWLGRRPNEGGAVAQEVRRPDRRRRLIPFATVMAFSFVTLLLWALMQNPLP